MSSWAKVGMKVVCVNAAWSKGDHPCPIIEGEIYLISKVVDIGAGDWCEIDMTGAVAVNLQGVWNDCHYAGVFCSNRFRPVVGKTQSEDVEMFQRLVDRIPNMEVTQ